MTVQIITLASEEYVVVPRMEYEALREAADGDASDAALVRRVLDDPDEELAPLELSERIARGEHPIRVWREHRGMKAGLLAKRAGVAASYLSDIEHGKKPGSAKTLAAIARALDVDLDEIVRSDVS